MSTLTAERPTDQAEPPVLGDRPLLSRPVLAALLTVLVGLVAGAAYLLPQPPAEDSAEVGFARDMSRHHAQAVLMAEALRDRTDDAELRTLASDIALTQQAQIGMMSAWLEDWGRSASASGPKMAWMGEPTTGLMPGMAAPAETAALATLAVDQAEAQFLRLMVAHHTGGVEMAEAGVELTDDPQVVQLARSIAGAQASEIDYLQSLLAARGLPPEPVPAGMNAVAGEEGHAGTASPALRETLLLSLVTVGLVAFFWLLIDSVARRAGSRRVPSGAMAAALTGPAVVTAAVHLTLTPEHAQQSVGYGLFFVLTALGAAAGAAVVVAGLMRTGAVALAGVSGLLLVTYVLFRFVAPPGADSPEDVDLWGVVAVTTELVILVAAASSLMSARRAQQATLA